MQSVSRGTCEVFSQITEIDGYSVWGDAVSWHKNQDEMSQGYRLESRPQTVKRAPDSTHQQRGLSEVLHG